MDLGITLGHCIMNFVIQHTARENGTRKEVFWRISGGLRFFAQVDGFLPPNETTHKTQYVVNTNTHLLQISKVFQGHLFGPSKIPKSY